MPHSAAGLGRHLRLLNSSQFRKIFRDRRFQCSKFFCIYCSPNNLSYPRIGLAVSKKVSKKAVDRNRIKRQIRENFRLYKAELSLADFVVVAKIGSAIEENVILRGDLKKLWRSINEKCENY